MPLTVGPKQRTFTNVGKDSVVEAGGFELMLGTSSRDGDLAKILLHVVQTKRINTDLVSSPT